jgi:branched-chain amino acid transport system substrate-binding protein
MKLPYFFLLLQQPQPMTTALVDMFKANGVKTIACIYVDDLFGLENYAALKVALARQRHSDD